jgi:YVTN family beta-propeller protein
MSDEGADSAPATLRPFLGVDDRMRRFPVKRFLLCLSALALCLLAITSCGSTTSRSASAVGRITARISSVGALSQDDNYDIAADDTAVWVHNETKGTVTRIDPKTNAVVATITVGLGIGQMAIGTDAVWVVSHDYGSVSKIDPQTNKVVDTIDLNGPIATVTVTPDALWVGSFALNTIVRIDLHTDKVVTTLARDEGPTFLAYKAGTIWTCNRGEPGLTRINPQTNQVAAQIDVGAGLICGGMAAEDDTVWALPFLSSNNGDAGISSGQVERIDPATNTVTAKITVPAYLELMMAADAHGVWVLDRQQGLFRIDPKTNTYVGKLAMSNVAGVAVGAGSVWCATGDGTVLRVEPTL